VSRLTMIWIALAITMLQDNWVGMSPIGIGISKRASDMLLYRNYFQWLRTPVVDKGRQTRQVDNVVREEEEYTPERGPIRWQMTMERTATKLNVVTSLWQHERRGRDRASWRLR